MSTGQISKNIFSIFTLFSSCYLEFFSRIFTTGNRFPLLLCEVKSDGFTYNEAIFL